MMDSPPIGRHREVTRIAAFLDDLAGGPRLLLFEGDAGIGKSTLLEYGRDAAVRRGHHVLSARPAEVEMPLAYAGLADLLGPVPDALIDALPRPQRHALRQAVFGLEPSAGRVDPHITSMAVRSLLCLLARDRPVVLVVDDLPWLDASSARILSFVLRRLRQEPVGLLAAWPAWLAARVMLGLERAAPGRLERVRVGPLSLDAIREIVSLRLGMPPGRSLLARLHEVSGGNPLFALELAERAHRGVPSELFGLQDVPESLRQRVLGLIAVLSSETRDVLLVCALAGDTSLPVVCAASRQPGSAQADLEVAIRSHLVTLADAKVVFSNPVTRSVIIEEARPSDRRAAHRRLASVVSCPEEQARHRALGAGAPDEPAAAAAEKAAGIAAARGACDIAGDLAELALAVTPLARTQARHRRIIFAAELRFASSDPARACSLLESIASSVPAGPARAELLRRLARYRAFCGRPFAEWTTTLRAALAQADGDPALRAVILLDRAVAENNSGNYPEARRYGLMATEAAEQAGNEALLAQCCAGMAFLAFLAGEGVRTDLIARARSGSAQAPLLAMEKRPNVAIGHILHWSGDLAGARGCYQEEYARAVAEGAETSLPIVLWAMAENEAWAGDWPRAEQLATEGCRLAEESASPAAIALMAGVRGLMHAYRGRIEAAWSEAERAAGIAETLGMPLLGSAGAQSFGIAALSVGDARRAHDRLGSLAETAVAAGLAEPSTCRFLPDEIEALIRLGQLGSAEAMLTLLEARAARLGRVWGLATAARCRGLLLAVGGDYDGAATALESALRLMRPLALPFEEARTLLIAGEVNRRARRKRAAVAFLTESRQGFDQLGAPLWVSRAQGELDRVGIRGLREVPEPGLTPAEQRVASLVVEGRTNNEIATELFMGQRTVEAHLSRVYRKLGVRSRTELCRVFTSPVAPGIG